MNTIAPGWIVKETARRGASEEALGARVSSTRNRTMGDAVGDGANAATFVAASKSGFVTAQMLTVDGGRMDCTGHG